MRVTYRYIRPCAVLYTRDMGAYATSAASAWRAMSSWLEQRKARQLVKCGYGIFHARILGQVFNSLTGIHTSDNVTFLNAFDPAASAYSIVWPNTFAGDPSRGVTRVGTQNFSTANDPNYKDPMTQQWSATFERELPLRLNYVSTGLGAQLTVYRVPPILAPIYNAHPVGVQMFFRIRLGGN